MELRDGTTTATIDPQGGRLASLRVDGIELLVTDGERPTRWGSFPMVPWCGRLRDGHLDVAGTGYEFPLTSPPHANHGFTHLQPWWEVEANVIRTDLGEPWPFGGHVLQRFELGANHLTVGVEVHADTRSFPAMAGWHPWFRRDLGTGGVAELIVDLSSASMFALEDDGIPSGELVSIPEGPWDACFTGLADDPIVRWPGVLDLTISSTFDHWVIYTQPEHALCVEPQSGAPNDLNRDPQIVEPGAPLVGSMTLTWG